MNLQTTLNIIRASEPCAIEWFKLIRSLPADIDYDTPIDFSYILQICGLDAAFWALRCVIPQQEKQRDSEVGLLACRSIGMALHIFGSSGCAGSIARNTAYAAAVERGAAWDIAAAAAAAAWDAEMLNQKAQFIARFCTEASQ